MLESVFDKALRADLPIDAQQIIRRQHNSLRESRDRVRRMQQEMSYSEAGGMMQSIGDTGRRSMEAVSQQFTERPMVSTMVAVGVGVVIGALLTSAVWPQSSNRYEDQSSGRYGGSDQFGNRRYGGSDQFGSRRYGEEQFGNRTDRRS